MIEETHEQEVAAPERREFLRALEWAKKRIQVTRANVEKIERPEPEDLRRATVEINVMSDKLRDALHDWVAAYTLATGETVYWDVRGEQRDCPPDREMSGQPLSD
jgi:hypothetical protein